MSLGSIIVRLTLDTASFDTDAGRAAKIAEKRAKEIDAAFRKAGIAIGAALGAAIVGLGAAVKKGIDHMDEMSKAAQKVGESTENFSRLAYAGELADIGMDQLVSTMGKLTKAQAAALDVGSQQAKIFDALGISVKDANGSLRAGTDVMMDFADKFKEAKGSPEIMAAGFQIFGRSFQDIIPLIKDGSSAMRELFDESDRFGATISTEAGEAAEKFNDNLTRLTTNVEGMAMSIAEDLLPNLIDMTDKTIAWLDEGDRAAEIAAALSAGIDTIGIIAKATTNLIGGLVDIVSGFVQQVEGFLGVLNAIARLDMSKLRAAGADFAEGSLKIGRGAGNIVNPKDAPAVLPNGGYRPRRESRDTSRAASAGLMPAGFAGGYDAWVKEQNFQADLKEEKERRAYQKRLQDALGGGSSESKKTGGRKPSSRASAAELLRENDRLKQSLNERIAMIGLETNAAKVNYEVTSGSLAKIEKAEKEARIEQAKKLDAALENQRLQQEGKRILEDLLTPMERVRKENEETAKALAAVGATQDQVNAAMRESPYQEMLGRMRYQIAELGMTEKERYRFNAEADAKALGANEDQVRAVGDLADQYTMLADARQLADSAGAAFLDMFESIADGSKSAGDAFRDFVGDMTKQIARFLMQKAVEQFITYIIGAFGFNMSSGGVGGNFGGGLAKGGIVDQSGVQAFAKGGAFTNGLYTQPTFFKYGSGGSFGVMGEAGPEAVMPLSRGADGKLGVTAQMGGGVTVIVENNGGAPAKVEESQGADGGRLIRVIVDQAVSEVTKQVGTMGGVGKAIGSRFGLSPVGASRG